MMRTWSLESAFVRAYSAAAVGVQGLIDLVSGVERITRPLGHDSDEAGCIGCGKTDCGETCANAAYYRSAEQLAEREAGCECWEPGELVPPPKTADDVCDRLDDIRNLLGRNGSTSIPAAGAAGTSSPEACDIPPSPSGERPDLAAWLEPAVMTILDAHVFRFADGIGSNAHCSCGQRPRGLIGWQEHVAAEMGAHIAKAVEADWLPQHKSKGTQ